MVEELVKDLDKDEPATLENPGKPVKWVVETWQGADGALSLGTKTSCRSIRMCMADCYYNLVGFLSAKHLCLMTAS